MPYDPKAAYRRYDAKRNKSEQRKKWRREYRQQPHIKAKEAEAGRKWRSKPGIKEAMAAYARGRRQSEKTGPRIAALDLAHYEAGRLQQAGRSKPDICDICGADDRKIVFDHCHEKLHFRGWICVQCNIALGMVNDDAKILLKMAAYLKRTSKAATRQGSLSGI